MTRQNKASTRRTKSDHSKSYPEQGGRGTESTRPQTAVVRQHSGPPPVQPQKWCWETRLPGSFLFSTPTSVKRRSFVSWVMSCWLQFLFFASSESDNFRYCEPTPRETEIFLFDAYVTMAFWYSHDYHSSAFARWALSLHQRGYYTVNTHSLQGERECQQLFRQGRCLGLCWRSK